MPAYLYFVDLTNAFDKVRLTDVIDLGKTLSKGETSFGNIAEVIHNLNTGNYRKIKTGYNYLKKK